MSSHAKADLKVRLYDTPLVAVAIAALLVVGEAGL